MPTIQPTPLDLWRTLAGRWKSDHPVRDPLTLEVGERRRCATARAAFHLAAVEESGEVATAISGIGCTLCGLPTASWCEGCYKRCGESGTFLAVCQGCDSEHRVCPLCEVDGVTYADGHEAYRQSHLPNNAAEEETAFSITAWGTESGQLVEEETDIAITFEELASQRSAASSGPREKVAPLAPESAMEPLLMELLTERNDAFLTFLTNIGVQTCRDLHNLWPSGAAMVEEFEAKYGKHSADEAFGMAMVFTLAGHRAHDALLQSIDMVVEERSSSQLQKPSLRLEVAPLTSITPTVRRVLDTGFRGPAPVLQACAAADPAVKEHATKQVKLNALFQLLLEDFIDVTELGLSWSALQDPMKLQKFKDTLMEAPSRLSFQRIGALTSSMRRWKRWAVQRGYSVQAPTPLQLSEFLREVASGGPTAASSMWHACHWFSEKMGCRLPTDHFLTRPFKMHAVTHTGSQALELSPGELVNLVLLASRSRGTKSVLLAFMIQSAVSCVRFEHIQRSTLVKCHKDFIEFRCSQGKSRRQGARPAYNWSTPEVHFQGWSLCATLKDFFSHEALPEVGYLWPALRLSAEDLWEVNDSTPFDLSRPMARSRFLELLRGTLLETGVEAGESVTAGYNRLRRFMPTLGNCLRLDKDRMKS